MLKLVVLDVICCPELGQGVKKGSFATNVGLIRLIIFSPRSPAGLYLRQRQSVQDHRASTTTHRHESTHCAPKKTGKRAVVTRPRKTLFFQI